MPCLSVQFNPSIGPVLNVLVAPAGSINAAKAAGQSPAVTTVPLLVDTGADITCISHQVAANLKLQSMGRRQVMAPTGLGAANTYMVDLAIAFGDPSGGQTVDTLIVDNLMVLEYQGTNPNYLGLLGRDILGRGLFAMATYDKRFTLAF